MFYTCAILTTYQWIPATIFGTAYFLSTMPVIWITCFQRKECSNWLLKSMNSWKYSYSRHSFEWLIIKEHLWTFGGVCCTSKSLHLDFRSTRPLFSLSIDFTLLFWLHFSWSPFLDRNMTVEKLYNFCFSVLNLKPFHSISEHRPMMNHFQSPLNLATCWCSSSVHM